MYNIRPIVPIIAFSLIFGGVVRSGFYDHIALADEAVSVSRESSREFPFDTEDALDEWQEKIFRDRVLYVVEAESPEGYLLASSDQACSGLFHKVRFNAKKRPMISWHWKVIRFPDKKPKNKDDLGWVEKDDYAARVYVIFPSWNFMRSKCIEYIWDERLPVDTIMTSPYSDNIKLIVAQSGSDAMTEWVFEERNIARDYEKAFGEANSLYVGAVAIMTDADNTVSTAESAYKDFRVGYANDETM